MRVLVTGGRGLVGTATVQALTQAGHDVTTFQRTSSGIGVREVLGDIGDVDAVRRAVEGQDAVVHSAARVSIAGGWAEFERVNVDGTKIVLEASRRAGVSRAVYVSSPSVAHAGHALVGVEAGPADPQGARGNYARSKAIAELACLAAASDTFAVCAIRPHLVWGPGDTQLIERIIDRARSGRLALIGSGLALIDTTYVDNAASALAAAVECANTPEVRGQAFVVSNGEPRTVAELLARIVQAAGLPAPRRHIPVVAARLGGRLAERIWTDGEPPMTEFLAEQLSTAHWFDQRRTRAALRWTPTVGLDEGFDRLRAWATGEPAGPVMP